MSTLPSIDPGKRAIIAGRTGSGKTTVACWLMARSSQHWIIFNPKHTQGYKSLPDAVVFRKFDAKGILSKIKTHKFLLLNFSGAEASHEFMDSVLEWLHRTLKNVGVCIDELYTFHSAGGRAGDGLIGWLTRGRELKQSYIGLTQRPAWISLFCFTEADFISAMDLTLKSDRKRMFEATGQEHFLDRLTGFRWLWYIVSSDTLALYGPVPQT